VRGLRRQNGIEQRQKTALELDALRSVIAGISDDPRGVRDRALMLIGWSGALRRSELAGIHVEDLRFESEGLILRIRRSKTDQEAAGDHVAIPFGKEPLTCPVQALHAWLAISAESGPVFRRIDRHGNTGSSLTPTAIAVIIQKRVEIAGIVGDFGGHSLRAGFATAAARAGRTETAIMRHGRWKSVQVARRYIRHGSRWIDNPAAEIGL
jgi:integrase